MMFLYQTIAPSVLLCLSMNKNNPSFQAAKTTAYSRCSRRKILSDVVGKATLTGAAVLVFPVVGRAEDPLFRPNPLTNRVLEKIRIMDQQYADNVKYDGELSTPSSDIGTAYAKLLIPILSIREDLRVVNERILEPNGSSLSQAQSLLNQPQYQSKELKRIFNAFADNIYYSDPDRANLYLAGGATPKTAQSLAYLLRNELLTSLDDLRTEIADLIKDREKGGVTTASDYSDLIEYGKKCNDAMSQYLALVPPDELKLAEKILGDRIRQN